MSAGDGEGACWCDGEGVSAGEGVITGVMVEVLQ